MSIKNIENRLNKMTLLNIQNICKKMKVKYTGNSKSKMIRELLLPFNKYKMKSETGGNTTCHNDTDLQLNEFVEGKYVNLGRYCVSLQDITGMIDNILTLRVSELGENAYLRTLANPYTNNPITPKNIRDIREMLQRNNDNELLQRFEMSIRERTLQEQVDLSNDNHYESDDDESDDDESDNDERTYSEEEREYDQGYDDSEESDIEEWVSQFQTSEQVLRYIRENRVSAEQFRELVEQFPDISDDIEEIVFGNM